MFPAPCCEAVVLFESMDAGGNSLKMKGESNNHFSFFAISLVGSCSFYIDVEFQGGGNNLTNACGKVVGYQC